MGFRSVCLCVSAVLLSLYSFASDADAANGVCLHCVVVECRSSSSEHSIPILACAGSRNTVGDNAADAAFKHTAMLVIILMTMAVTGAPLEL